MPTTQKQVGAGKCSICSSPGTNSSTCPCNPNISKSKWNLDKHPLCKKVSGSKNPSRMFVVIYGGRDNENPGILNSASYPSYGEAISAVLNNIYDSIKDEIMQLVEDDGYHPNEAESEVLETLNNEQNEMHHRGSWHNAKTVKDYMSQLTSMAHEYFENFDNNRKAEPLAQGFYYIIKVIN